MASSQPAKDLQTRDSLAHGLPEPGEGGTSATDRALADLRLANVAAAVASGDLLARWELGVEAVTRCLQPERHD